MAKLKNKLVYEDKWEEYLETAIEASKKKNYKKFEELMHKALKEGEKYQQNPHLQPDYPVWFIDDMVAGPLSMLGSYYLSKDKFEKARQYLERSLEIHLKHEIKDMEFLDELIQDLSEAYCSLHMHNEDVKHCTRTLEVLSEQLGSDSPDMIPTLNELAMAYCSLGKLSSAENTYKQALKIAEAACGVESEEYEEALAMLEEFEEEKDWAVCDCHPLAATLIKPL